MDRPIGNDNRMHRLLEVAQVPIYILYTTLLSYFLYEGERKLRNPRISEKLQLLLTKENNS